MKTSKKQLVQHLEDTYSLEGREEDAVKAVLQSIVDLELPNLEEELEKYEGKKFVTLGKVEFLEEIQDEL